MKRLMVLSIAFIATLMITSVIAHADEFIWGNNASATITLEEVDVTNGTVVQTFSPGGGITGNGRGILAFSNNTIYWSMVGSANVFITDAVTHANNGVLFTAKDSTGANLPGIGDLAWDGSHIWATPYTSANSGLNVAYEYTLAGTLLNTVPISQAAGSFDGFEIANGNLVANRFDGGLGPGNSYDVYNTSGALLTPQLIGPVNFDATGIAFDGTDYFVSDIGSGGLDVYDSSGMFVRSIALTKFQAGMEDLSAVEAVQTPEPASPSLLFGSITLLGLLGYGWRRRKQRA